ncbi:glycosyltransferase family protein [Rothia sp. P5764]|uniref:glycosyltransferase family protein n=1 Tax=Rothia sp. P5764 TaxID=3402654 RepID=UPI003AD0C5DD
MPQLLSPSELRRALWHFRRGGLRQVRKFRRRQVMANHFGGAAFSSRSRSGGKGLGLASEEAVGAVPQVSKDRKTPAGYRLDFLPLDYPSYPPVFEGLKVATILDDFSALAWGFEFTTLAITPENWREVLEREKPDFLLVESAWAGNDGTWQYHLTGESAPRPAVKELLAYTRQEGIPSVFWNKEDPPHFEDFLATAALFDFVFTSDSNMVTRYQQELGHERVYPLAFAAQPAVHNPVRPHHGVAERGAAFAGSYFAHKYPERREQMDYLLKGARTGAAQAGEPFEIFSRFLGQDERYQFPQPLTEHVVGSQSYQQMLVAYKAYKVFLNVNSVVDSPSMCARRIFEILASGTPVLTSPSAAITSYFDETMIQVAGTEDQARQATRALLASGEYRDRQVHLAQRHIWSQHTYSHRALTILNALASQGKLTGPFALGQPSVSVIASTCRPEQVEHLLEQVGQQTVQAELVLLTHGFTLDSRTFQDRARQAGIERARLLTAGSERSLGYCLNQLVDAAHGEVLAKMDDDDLYGPHYLEDSLHALRFSRADVVGKQAYYMHLQGLDATVVRAAEREHRFTDFVAGPTLLGYRRIFQAHPFEDVSTGEDTAFLESVAKAGGRIYSADRFNFVQVRRAAGQGAEHTWDISDSRVLAHARVHHYGLSQQHIFF